ADYSTRSSKVFSVMNDDERQDEIIHLKELLSILVKKRRWYEIQLAKFEGPHIPFHLADEIDRTKTEIEKTELRLVQLGEVSHLPITILDRLTTLEYEVTTLRRQLERVSAELEERRASSTGPILRDSISHGGDWFLVTEESITIHDQTYLAKDLFPY